jgi:glycosyltransferase involved in cell wall biosynthesis
MSASSREPLLARVRRRLRRTAARRPPEPVGTGSVESAGSAEPPDVAPVVPEVVEERTNIGPKMDALVTRVRRNQRPLGLDPDYDLLRENFDYTHYMLQAQPLHDRPEVDPIRLFLRNGANASYSPNYNFSMKDYLSRHPERKEGPERSPYLEWVKRGRAAGEIADPAQGIEEMSQVLNLEPRQIVDEVVATRTDMMERLRTGKLGEVFAKATEVEPLIGALWNETARTRMIPLQGRNVAGQVAAIHACQEAADFRRARLVVAINRPRWGGGRRLEGHLAHALDGTIAPDDIVIVYTDKSGDPPQGRFPGGVREVDFAAAAEGLPDEHKQQALVSLLRSFNADAIVNLNSRALYGAMVPYGKALATTERIFLCFLVHEQRAQGNWFGFPLQFFYPHFDEVAGVITDSEYLRDHLTYLYQLSDADRRRIHVFRAPVEPELTPAPPAPAEPSRRPLVFWAGRWDRQKRVDIALEVARRMPDVDFRLYGEAVFRGDPVGQVPENVQLSDRYGHITDLDLEHADAWLYTSAWDGVPSLLLEVAMTEVPIVASLVGGVGEVLSDEDSWPVAEWEDPEAYEKALREILSDPAEARRRSHALRERLERDRTQRAYGEYAAEVLLHRTGTHSTSKSKASSTTDLTLIVTAHDETVVAGPTMRSADLAVEAARERGYTVQAIIALDAATEATTAYFQQPRFDHWERRIMNEGDLGRVRNALLPDTDGELVAFLDADDLFSENWLAEGIAAVRAGETRGETLIAHPELNVLFDRNRAVSRNLEQDSPLFTPHYLYVRNLYDSLCLAPREAHVAAPYTPRDIPNGLSFQDFQFSIETMARGWKHVVVKDTIIFKRRRDFSLMVENKNRRTIVRSLPEMAIDRVRDLAAPHG